MNTWQSLERIHVRVLTDEGLRDWLAVSGIIKTPQLTTSHTMNIITTDGTSGHSI